MSRCMLLAAALFDQQRTPGEAFRGIDRGVMNDIERPRWRRLVGGSRAGTLFAPVQR